MDVKCGLIGERRWSRGVGNDELLVEENTMNDAFTQRVRTAATAAWWAILIGAIWMTAAWLISLALLRVQPDWLLKLWGGGELTWEWVHTIMLKFFAAVKVILISGVFLTIWVSLWAARLKRAQ